MRKTVAAFLCVLLTALPVLSCGNAQSETGPSGSAPDGGTVSIVFSDPSGSEQTSPAESVFPQTDETVLEGSAGSDPSAESPASEEPGSVSPEASESGKTPDDPAEPSEPGESNESNEFGGEEPETGKSVLVAYFSVTGNTAPLARYAAEITDADLYEIVPEVPYTEEDIKYYTDCRADREQNDPSARPAIAGKTPDTSGYGVVFIGYPIWHGQAPRIISTFLESVKLSGVTVVPFCTSHSSGIGSSDTDLHPLAPDANWIRGSRFAAGTQKEEMEKWIGGLGLETASHDEPKEEGLMNVTASGKTFRATFADTDAARAFAKMLPLTAEMTELNGNEKYVYLDQTLPAASAPAGSIEAGDIMLYGSKCIVIFYESFESSYSYTRIGKISDPEGLKDALGRGSVTVTFKSGGKETSSDASGGAFDFETKTVKLNSGYVMPILGLGTYSLDHDTCVNSVTALLESGGRLIDTAYMYRNEDAVGEGVRKAMKEYGIPREDIFVITKIYPSQFDAPEAAIEQALEKLDIGYIDMMLLHHPGKNDVKAYKAMEKYVEAGRIRSLGLSNWYVEELTDFLPQVSITPALVQNEIHPYYQEQDVVPFIQSKGIVVQCWYPLGGRGHTSELLGNETIAEIASAHGVSPAQVILRWDLQRGIVVIPGSGNPDHIRENLDLFGFELTAEEMKKIRSLDRNEKHDWY